MRLSIGSFFMPMRSEFNKGPSVLCAKLQYRCAPSRAIASSWCAKGPRPATSV
jgi:hypothetical protein